MKALEVSDLWVTYGSGEDPMNRETGGWAVKGVSFSVEKGETAGVIGVSGSGKSTAMLAVMGLLGKAAEIRAERVSVSGEEPVPGRNIAMIFQDSLNCLNPAVKIGRQIMETVQARRKCGRREARERALELLDQVGIRDGGRRMKQYPFELSGGMRQRVVIAIALACEPELIIADEPTTALDPVVQAQILLLLKRVVEETGTALLLVSHDPGVTAALCRRIYVMKDGQIIESGWTEDVFYGPEQEYTRSLLKGRRLRPGGGTEACPEDLFADSLLSLRHLTKDYGRKRSGRRRPAAEETAPAEGIQDLSFDIGRGEIMALVGESGSGKTTLARILSGILQPDSGEIRYRGSTFDPAARPGRIQMVFQDPYTSLNPALTVEEALLEALRPLRQGPGRTRAKNTSEAERVNEILRLAGLGPDAGRKYPGELSGGQRQRAGIARALIVEPELLICDEATASLDPVSGEQILDLLLQIRAEKQIACLFISHDLSGVRRISSRIGVMYMGTMAEMGETEEVCADPWHPYTKQLLEAVPEPDPVRAMKKIRRSARKREDPAQPWGQTKSRDQMSPQSQAGGCPFAPRCGYVMECCWREKPELYRFGSRGAACFLYSEEHTGKRAEGYRMVSQI